MKFNMDSLKAGKKNTTVSCGVNTNCRRRRIAPVSLRVQDFAVGWERLWYVVPRGIAARQQASRDPGLPEETGYHPSAPLAWRTPESRTRGRVPTRTHHIPAPLAAALSIRWVVLKKRINGTKEHSIGGGRQRMQGNNCCQRNQHQQQGIFSKVLRIFFLPKAVQQFEHGRSLQNRRTMPDPHRPSLPSGNLRTKSLCHRADRKKCV
jgi:hypothetical protein